MDRVKQLSLKGILRPITVAPYATLLTIGGLGLMVWGAPFIYQNAPTIKRTAQALSSGMGLGITYVGLLSYKEAYRMFFRGLKTIANKRITDHETLFYNEIKELKNPCAYHAYKTAARFMGKKEEFHSAARRLREDYGRLECDIINTTS